MAAESVEQQLFQNNAGPGRSLAALTPSDATVYSPALRGIRNGGAAAITVVVDGQDAGSAIAFHNVASGETLVGYFKKVYATGTTGGADLVGMW